MAAAVRAGPPSHTRLKRTANEWLRERLGPQAPERRGGGASRARPGRELLESRPHELLCLGVRQALLEPSKRQDAHAQDAHDEAGAERGGIEALELHELVRERLADGGGSGIVKRDERVRVKRGDGEAQRPGHERVALGIVHGQATPILGRVAQGVQRRVQGLAIRSLEQPGHGAVRSRHLGLALHEQHVGERVAGHDDAGLREVSQLGPCLVEVFLTHVHPGSQPHRCRRAPCARAPTPLL